MQKITNYILSFLSFMIIIGLQACANNPYANQDRNLPKDTKIEIAILMPQTGANGTLGREYADLIKMGLEDGAKANINITTYDAADEMQALNSIQKIIKRDTKLILGPLTSPITSFITPKAKAAGIIVITMSNNPVLTDEKLYVFGHAPSKQLKPLFDYFFANNYKNFITLLPAGTHSQNVNKIIQNMIIAHGATLARAEFYTEDPENISQAVKIVADSVDNLNEEDDEIPRKTVIYLGDDQNSLKLVFDKIKALGLDQKAVIAGDNRLDFDYPQGLDIVFSGSLNILNSDVIAKAQSKNIYYLTFMHALAYDLGKMSAQNLGEEFNETRFLSRLNTKHPYIGVAGDVYFVDNIAQRRYDIISRVGGDYTTLVNSRISQD